MADPQEEARNKQAVPQGTMDHLEELKQQNASARGEYLKQQEALNEAAKEYGFSTGQQLMNRVSSDFNFAQKLVLDLLTGEKNAPKGAQLPDSSQENNVTGRLDHTVTPAVKIGEVKTQPVNDGVTATASEPVETSSVDAGAAQ